jgi:hypothetical protein
MIETQDLIRQLANQPAEVREAFDEKRLKFEWDLACEDETDAVSRKQAVLRKALAQWPMARQYGDKGAMVHHPEMRRFVRDVLGMRDREGGGMNNHAAMLLREGAREKRSSHNNASQKQSRAYRRAVIELVTKYKLGADPRACMEALSTYYEEINRVSLP